MRRRSLRLIALLFLLLAARHRLKMMRATPKHYLLKNSLPSPISSPLIQLFNSGEEIALINGLGFDRASLTYLRDLLDQTPYFQNPLRRSKVSSLEMVIIVIQYLRTKDPVKNISFLVGRAPSTLRRALIKGQELLLSVLSCNEMARIEWPKEEEMKKFHQMMLKREPSLEACSIKPFGVIDGTRYKMENPSDPEVQNVYYSGKERTCCINNVYVTTPDGCICLALANYPGSWHDSRVALPLFRKLLDVNFTPENYGLIGDQGFPSMRNKILVTNEEQRNSQYSKSVLAGACSIRQSAEWSNNSLIQSFPILAGVLPFNPDKTRDLLSLILFLFNFRTRTMGLNQTKTVFQ
jgi:hypothetical protein